MPASSEMAQAVSVIIGLLAAYGLLSATVSLVARVRRQRRPTPPRPIVTPAMQSKMARALTTLITSGGMRELQQANKIASGYSLRREHFEALAVPPEEDFARANLMERIH